MVASSSNLLNDTQYYVLPSLNPGLKQTMPSGDPLHCVFPLTPPEECVNPTGEGKDIYCNIYIQEKMKNLPVGVQAQAVPSRVGKNKGPTG